MKKITFIMFALGATFTHAQDTFDFESYTLPATESFDNGQAAGGSFILDQIVLQNYYTVDTVWGDYWAGFSISNVTDNTTPGWGNQYSSYTGSGADGSDNYGIYYGYGSMDALTNNTSIDSFKITNTTFAALSMRDGDEIGKQFGSIYNAQGSIDGTNGEDYFRVWIYASDATSSLTDSLVFYLADYRFQDSTQDYILDAWETIDLTGFGFQVAHVNFKFESSDKSGAYLNTPTYFAIDDISWGEYLAVDEHSSKTVTAYPNPFSDKLNLTNYEGSYELYDAMGRIVHTGVVNPGESIPTEHLDRGTYRLRLNNQSDRLLVK